MNYDNLLEYAFREVPEFEWLYQKELSNDGIDDISGVHTVFSLVFVPLFREAIAEQNKLLQDRIASFIERMENSDDSFVQEVSQFTVLEEMLDEYPYEKLDSILLTQGRKSLKQISQYITKPLDI